MPAVLRRRQKDAHAPNKWSGHTQRSNSSRGGCGGSLRGHGIKTIDVTAESEYTIGENNNGVITYGCKQ